MFILRRMIMFALIFAARWTKQWRLPARLTQHCYSTDPLHPAVSEDSSASHETYFTSFIKYELITYELSRQLCSAKTSTSIKKLSEMDGGIHAVS